MRKSLLLSLAMLISAGMAFAQDRTVSGKVTSDEDGSAVPGVNVVVKGTTTGAVTDIDGNYKLSVPADGGTLIFSFIGLETQEVEIGSRGVIDLSMTSDAEQLAEVIVTAHGIQREKKALGYAVTNIGSENIAQKSEPDAIRVLQSKIPGVQINAVGGTAGGGTRINIRGNSSLLGDNSPLFVVDGVPFDNSATATGGFTSATGASSTNRAFDLDPNNIESMTVLKGAAASALYGSRASNGVIVITTKSGKGGGSKKGLEVTFSTSYSQENVANLPEYQTRYTQGNNFKYVDGNFGTWGAPFDLSSPAWLTAPNADKILSIDPSTGLGYVRHPYDRYNNPDNAPYFPEFVGDSILLTTYNTPEDFFRTGSVFETAVSVSAGGEKSNIIVGVSRTINKGIIPENEVERISANVGGSATLDNGLFVSGSVNYVRTDLTTPPNGGFYAGAISIMDRLLYTPPNVNAKGLPFEDSQGNHAWYRPDNDNPYFLVNYAPHTSLVNRVYGNLSASYDVTDWINVAYRIGANTYVDKKNNILPRGISNGQQLGTVRDDNFTNTEIDGNFIVTINRNFNEELGFVARLGHNWNKRTTERNAYFAINQIVPGITNPANYQDAFASSSSRISERSYSAFYADISFDYRNYLFLNIQGRNDITSTLPKANRSYFYGGVSSSFVFTDAFDITSNIFSTGKVRASIARTGSDNVAYQTQLITYSTNANSGIEFPFQSAINGSTNSQTMNGQLGNPNLTPEFTTEYEFGTELGFWNNRISLDATYYSRSTTDQIVAIALPRSTGFTSKVSNIGELTNKGIEIGLNADLLQIGDFNWNMFVAFDRNRNIVVSLTEGLDKITVGGFSNDVRIVHQVGKPFGQIEGSVAARGPNGELLIDPATGKLIDGGFDLIGDPNYDYKLGYSNTFSWKGISLNVLIDYRVGGDVWSGTYNQVYGRGLTTGTVPEGPRGREVTVIIPGIIGDPATGEAVLDAGGQTIPNGTQLTVNDWYFINTFGSAGYDEFSVFDATTIRLREVSLGYTLPKSLLSKTPFGTVTFTFTGRNLWFNAVNFPSDMNFDPESVGLGANSNALGLDFGMIPSTKRYGVNLSLTF